MRVDETVLKGSIGRTVACVAKGRTVDVYHSEIALGHNLILASAIELGLSPHLHINLACDVAAQEEGLGSLRLVPKSVGNTFASSYSHGYLASFPGVGSSSS